MRSATPRIHLDEVHFEVAFGDHLVGIPASTYAATVATATKRSVETYSDGQKREQLGREASLSADQDKDALHVLLPHHAPKVAACVAHGRLREDEVVEERSADNLVRVNKVAVARAGGLESDARVIAALDA